MSNEPGQENPVTVRMADLPQDGKYNLLGTENGLYDKLTSNKVYGGYYKYVGDIDEFTHNYLDNYEIYDGTNVFWGSMIPQIIDAAEMEPEESAIYVVKEAPHTYLRLSHLYYTRKNTETITRYFIIGSIDSDRDNYAKTGFEIDGIDTDSEGIYTSFDTDETKYYITDFWKNSGVKGGYLSILKSEQVLSVGEHTLLAYWITPDLYKVTGIQFRTLTFTDLTTSGFSYSSVRVPITITKWSE